MELCQLRLATDLSSTKALGFEAMDIHCVGVMVVFFTLLGVASAGVTLTPASHRKANRPSGALQMHVHGKYLLSESGFACYAMRGHLYF